MSGIIKGSYDACPNAQAHGDGGEAERAGVGQALKEETAEYSDALGGDYRAMGISVFAMGRRAML